MVREYRFLLPLTLSMISIMAIFQGLNTDLEKELEVGQMVWGPAVNPPGIPGPNRVVNAAEWRICLGST